MFEMPSTLGFSHGIDFFFFFSSRRRHTRFDCDWSSDVCSSDLRSGRSGIRGRRRSRFQARGGARRRGRSRRPQSPMGRLPFSRIYRRWQGARADRESGGEGKRGDLGGGRVIKKKKKKK